MNDFDNLRIKPTQTTVKVLALNTLVSVYDLIKISL